MAPGKMAGGVTILAVGRETAMRQTYAGGALGAAGWKPARATPGYFSQMVTGGALTIPTVRAAAVSPGATKPAGMRALICRTPIMPGALPAYRMSALTPEMVNEIARSGCG